MPFGVFTDFFLIMAVNNTRTFKGQDYKATTAF